MARTSVLVWVLIGSGCDLAGWSLGGEGHSCDGENVLDSEGRVVETCREPERCGAGGDGFAACALPVGEGQACESEASTRVCRDGLECTNLGNEISVCVDWSPRSQGERCVLENGDLVVPCMSDLGCSLGGTCERRCALDSECAPDEACEPSACGGVCTRFRVRGASCDEVLGLDGLSELCAQRARCSAGLSCVPTHTELATCEVACSSDADCAAGTFCAVSDCGSRCRLLAELDEVCAPADIIWREDGTSCERPRRCAEGLSCEPKAGATYAVCVAP